MGLQRVGHDWVANTFTFIVHLVMFKNALINRDLILEDSWSLSTFIHLFLFNLQTSSVGKTCSKQKMF